MRIAGVEVEKVTSDIAFDAKIQQMWEFKQTMLGKPISHYYNLDHRRKYSLTAHCWDCGGWPVVCKELCQACYQRKMRRIWQIQRHTKNNYKKA